MRSVRLLPEERANTSSSIPKPERNYTTRRCGGIGRRTGFKIQRGQPRVGSTPTVGRVLFKISVP